VMRIVPSHANVSPAAHQSERDRRACSVRRVIDELENFLDAVPTLRRLDRLDPAWTPPVTRGIAHPLRQPVRAQRSPKNTGMSMGLWAT